MTNNNFAFIKIVTEFVYYTYFWMEYKFKYIQINKGKLDWKKKNNNNKIK